MKYIWYCIEGKLEIRNQRKYKPKDNSEQLYFICEEQVVIAFKEFKQ